MGISMMVLAFQLVGYQAKISTHLEESDKKKPC